MLNKNRPKNLLFISFIIGILSFPVLSFADAEKIFKENSKAVVVVVTFNEKDEPISQGSGFVVRADGAVVTNYHVISNAKGIKVKAGDKVLDVEGLIYEDKGNDLVILKAKGEKLPIVKIGDIEKEKIGEKVYVISSPKGLENTISDGLLSGIREITSEKKVLQITAPVSPGSSGGPVFNKDGEVIGIATFLLEEAQNLNFAMPVNVIKGKIGNKKITTIKDSEITDYKKTAEYWFVLGFYYANSGKYKEAIEACKQAIRIKPDDALNSLTHIVLGAAYLSSGMYKEAAEAYKQAVRIKPDFAVAHFALGTAYGQLGMHKEAAEAYKQAITIKPDFAEAHYWLGRSYNDLGMYKEEIESYKQAIMIKPDYAEAYSYLGSSYGDLGMHKEAIDACKQAIRIEPDNAKAHLFLGNAYVLSGMHKEAVESYKQAIRIKPDYAERNMSMTLRHSLSAFSVYSPQSEAATSAC
jgi:tetratricopeptide (TPR) repeat protein